MRQKNLLHSLHFKVLILLLAKFCILPAEVRQMDTLRLYTKAAQLGKLAGKVAKLKILPWKGRRRQ
jgi:hypothetical protein